MKEGIRGFASVFAALGPERPFHLGNPGLIQKDGPMLEVLKRLNGETIYPPNRDKDRPDRDRLALRFERFKAAV